MKIKFVSIACLIFVLLISACSIVDITKTAKGYYEPTDPNNVEILMTKPEDNKYIELGMITAANFNPKEIARMHNGLRNKSATLGAHAVILLSHGFNDKGLWATGVAIRWE